MIRRLVAFRSGDFELTATVDLPHESEGARFPSVLFCHGFTGNRFETRRLYARLGRILADCGIASFRFDHRGCGESEGDFLDFTADGYLQDLDGALDTFLKQAWMDPEKTAVVGYSLGGASASYVLGKCPGFLTGVLWAPVARAGIIRERLEQNPAFASYREAGYYDLGGFRVSSDYLDRIGEVAEPLKWIKKFARPVLFIHGANDDVVLPEHSEQLMHVRANEGDQRVVIPDADHAFSTAANGDLVLEHTQRWLQDHLVTLASETLP